MALHGHLTQICNGSSGLPPPGHKDKLREEKCKFKHRGYLCGVNADGRTSWAFIKGLKSLATLTPKVLVLKEHCIPFTLDRNTLDYHSNSTCWVRTAFSKQDENSSKGNLQWVQKSEKVSQHVRAVFIHFRTSIIRKRSHQWVLW